MRRRINVYTFDSSNKKTLAYENDSKFKDDNRTQVIAKGFETQGRAESAIDSFLSEQGDSWGRKSDAMDEFDEFNERIWFAWIYESE